MTFALVLINSKSENRLKFPGENLVSLMIIVSVRPSITIPTIEYIAKHGPQKLECDEINFSTTVNLFVSCSH